VLCRPAAVAASGGAGRAAAGSRAPGRRGRAQPTCQKAPRAHLGQMSARRSPLRRRGRTSNSSPAPSPQRPPRPRYIICSRAMRGSFWVGGWGWGGWGRWWGNGGGQLPRRGERAARFDAALPRPWKRAVVCSAARPAPPPPPPAAQTRASARGSPPSTARPRRRPARRPPRASCSKGRAAGRGGGQGTGWRCVSARSQHGLHARRSIQCAAGCRVLQISFQPSLQLSPHPASQIRPLHLVDGHRRAVNTPPPSVASPKIQGPPQPPPPPPPGRSAPARG
jgi:hypothetical protein